MEPYATPKKMKRLGDLFDAYKHRLKAPQASVEKVCVQVIKEVTGFELTLDQVTYTVSTQTVSLSVPSMIKSELKIQQQAILDRLRAELGADRTPEVLL